jgi:carnitine 3-dehydrogenase
VESHIRYLDELSAGERLIITTQLLAGEGKKMHLFHRLHRIDGLLAATVEVLLIHVDLKTRRSCPPSEAVALKLESYAKAHAKLPMPEGAGRFVGAALAKS